MSTLKKTLSIILAVLMLVSSVPAAGLTAFAVEADEPVFIAEEILEPVAPAGYYLTGKTNFDEQGEPIYEIDSLDSEDALAINLWIYADGSQAKNPDVLPAYPEKGEDGVPDVMGEEELPDAYDSRDYGYITPVEFQIGGTCWAHTAIACIETAYIKQGYGSTVDLSEYHLAWYSKNGYFADSTDSLNDGYQLKNKDDVLGTGGNYIDVQNAVLNFAGGAKESRFPLTSTSESKMMTEMKNTFTFDDKYIYDVVVDSVKSLDFYYLKNITGTLTFDVDKDSPRFDYIKQAIVDYGAVYLSYCSDDNYYINEYSSTKPCAYYNPNDVTTNHAVTLVGWDDNFSRENFGNVKPENDGAWLIKNSWGTSWGDEGYFWISYEDKSISNYAAVFSVDNAADYEEVYMYDGFGYQKSLSASSASLSTANVFTANNDIYLTKVSYGSTITSEYTLEIYRDIPENCTDPTSGTLVLSQTGNTNGQKYIDIQGNAAFDKGTRFSVVLKMNRAFFEGPDTEATEEYARFNSNSGESFYKAGSGAWEDASEGITVNGTVYNYNNTCIRAVAKLQDDSGSYKVTFKDGDYYSETVISENGTVALPEKEGYTYVLTYNGVDFDGTGITQDSVINMHCYPTLGEISTTKNCTTEYNCIYCGKQMKDPVTSHNYINTVIPATVKTIGYTLQQCSNCSSSGRTGYTLYEGADGGEYEKTSGMSVSKIWWQYIDGNLSIISGNSLLKKLPDFSSSSEKPWSAYLNEITTLTVMDGIIYIGDYCFSGLHALSELNLTDDIEEIGDYCFSGAYALKSFDCPESLTKIGTYAFNGAYSLEEINYNDDIKTIGQYAYKGCSSLTEGVVPGSVTSVGNFIFYNCQNITKITVEEGVTRLPYVLWCESGHSKLEEIVLPSTVTSVSFLNYARLNKYTVSPDNKVYCSVDGIVYSKDMKTLYAYPATKTGKYFVVPESVENINRCAFSFIYYLKYLDMSACSVSSIGTEVFNQVKSISYVNLPATLTEIKQNGFYRTRFSNLYIPSTVSSISSGAFNTDGDTYCKIPAFYTDSENAKIKEFADTNGYTCTVLHTAHDFSTTMSDMSVAPTCKDAGTSLKTCACGNFEYTIVPATGEHSLVKGNTVAPTCENEGYTVYTCSACGTTENKDKVTALGHDYQWITDTEATCGADGEKHEKCSRCDSTRNENTTIPATGEHNYTSEITISSTHLEEGVRTYTCTVCNDSYTESVAKLEEHEYRAIVKDPTCTDKGYTTYTCACGDSYVSDYVDALGHSYSSKVTTAPTCEDKGVKTYTCANCGDTYTEEIDALGHSYSKKVTAPTCEDEGYTTYTCACSDSYVADYVDALGHDFAWIIDKDATCGADGVKHEKCSRCDSTRNENTTIPATGEHNYTSEITISSTHLEEGVRTYTCTVCNDSYTESVAKLEGHTYEKSVTAPTCTDKGYTTYTCACGDTYVSDYVDARGHNYKTEVTTAPTCEDDGVETYTCSNCGDSYTKAIAAIGHSYAKSVTAPTCTDKGYTTYTCTCGDTYKADEKAALGHKYKSEVTATPTCTAKGEKTFTCANCGDTYTEEIAANGHSIVYMGAKAPTCTEKGYKAYEYCTKCDHSTYEEVAATGHDYKSAVTAPTCTAKGYSTYTCANCGDSYTADEVPAKGHSYGVWSQIKAPTCTVKGEEARSCSACGNTEIREVATIDHVYTSKVTAPTCDKDGYTTYTCSVCGNGYTSDIVKAKGHEWGEWVVLKESTCTEKGAMECECANCGGKWFSEIAMANHIYKSTVVNPTCTEKGYTLYECKKCTDVQKDKFVDALGHSDADADTFCDACGAEMPAKECSCMCHQSGFMGFIYKIISFFWKLFKMNPVCECGAAHY